MYRHVDILNKHGYNAFVLHIQDGFRLTWFSNETKVVGLSEFKKMYDIERDFIACPEDLGNRILSFPGRKVIVNQNCYYGFYCFDFQKPQLYPYLHPDIKGVIVKSDHNKEYLGFAYPGLKIYRVYNSIDPEKFVYQPIRNKKKMIACLPSKNPMDLSQIYHILLSRSDQGVNSLKDYEWVFIRNRPEADVIRILRDSLIFIFLSTEEGFGRMPVEAMDSGCLVVAYGAGPLSEFLHPENSFSFTKGDVISVVKSVEEITHSFPENIKKLQTISEAALKTASRYSLRREEESVVAAWHETIGRMP